MSSPTRIHSLDVARAGALMAGVVLHSTSSFWPGFREANWPISDDSSSLFLAAVFFVIHVFRMSLFFAISGFFAHLLFERLGTWGFIKNRLRRIALPFLAAIVVILPLLILPFIWAQKVLGIHGPPAVTPPVPDPQLPPWGHLWFLYLLLVFYGLWLGARGLLVLADRHGVLRPRIKRVIDALMSSGLAPVAFAVPVAVLLVQSPWWLMWQGLPAPIMGFVPNLPAVAAYGGAFAFGWLLYQRADWLEGLSRRFPAHLAVAAILTAVSLWLVGPQPHLKPHAMDPTARAVYAMTYVTAGWYWIFAIIGAAQRFFSTPSAHWRYLADASFFVYLFHLPVVYLLQTWMIRWPLHWSVKFPLIVMLTFAVSLTVYHFLVRSTFVGQFLNGRRYPRSQVTALDARTGPA